VGSGRASGAGGKGKVRSCNERREGVEERGGGVKKRKKCYMPRGWERVRGGFRS